MALTKEEIIKKIGVGGKEEYAEESKDNFQYTGWPKPGKRFKIIWEIWNLSIEETYFWMLNYLTEGWGYVQVEKIYDMFTAAENSSFFGVSQQRLGLQQDKVSQFLATIGKMVKELFQIVRELRIIDERMDYYKDSYNPDRRKAEPAEITLKGIFIDMVEQGAKNPSSVYGMARELQFVTLPDLFFSTHPRKADDVEDMVDNLKFNRKVREVLKRKLYGFLRWKENTFKEIKNRRRFTIKYLRQHYDIIKMYMNWVRPYLRNIQRLTMDEKWVKSPHLISAFEGSIIEIEFLAKRFPFNEKEGKYFKKVFGVIIAHFIYRTRPHMSFQQEGYQRGPGHFGRIVMELRSYAWTQEEIDLYKQLKVQEDFELMKSISASVEAAYTALGDDLQNYLEEAGERFPGRKSGAKEGKKKGRKRPKSGFFRSAASVAKKKSSEEKALIKAERSKAQGDATEIMFNGYKNFKKGHGLVAW